MSDWIKHAGKGVPEHHLGRLAECIFETLPDEFGKNIGVIGSNGGLSWDWSFWRKPHPTDGYLVARVVRYRLLDIPNAPAGAKKEISA